LILYGERPLASAEITPSIGTTHVTHDAIDGAVHPICSFELLWLEPSKNCKCLGEKPSAFIAVVPSSGFKGTHM